MRRGLVGSDFFERLAAARPRRRDDIRKVCDAWFAGPKPAPGELWSGRYRLDAQVGDGGFGSVWRAVDEQTGQLVALKILHAFHHGNLRVRKRFLRGAQTLAGLSHPSIVRIFGAVEAGSRCFYTMEYIRGATLDTCVRERRYPTQVLLALTLQIGDALAHVHHHGLLHRDIKPSNILISAPDVTRLIDFDLVTGDDYVALTTEAIGTGLYMPTEAYTSDRKTGAYDVFSLARTIEFVLRGREPTARELTDVADLPASAEVRAILRAALQPDPQRRIANMATFCSALRAALVADSRSASRSPPIAAAEPDVAATTLWYKHGAFASIVGHVVAILYLAPPTGSLPILLFLTVPSVRVLTDREDSRLVNVVQWIWIGLWLLPAFGILSGLLDSRTTSKIKAFPVFFMLAALAVGVLSSVTYLRRPRVHP